MLHVDMVSFDERLVPCTIHNSAKTATKKKINMMLRSTLTVSQLFAEIRKEMGVHTNFVVKFTPTNPDVADQKVVTMHESDNKMMHELGINFESQHRLFLNLVSVPSADQVDSHVNSSPDSEIEALPAPTQRRKAIFEGAPDSTVADDMDLALGASASPVDSDGTISILPLFSDEPSSSTSVYPCKFHINSNDRMEIYRIFIFIHSNVASIIWLCRPSEPSDDLLFEQFVAGAIHDT